jgi:prepilin peptidase CpaA
MLIAICAGVTDWRFRRIPNWLTLSGFTTGVVVNTILFRWNGAKSAMLGAALGLALLLPFLLIRSLGAGDWKFAGALGACLGPRQLVSVLIATIFLAGLMALVVVIYKGRIRQTLLNIVHVLAAFFSLRLPPRDISLDNPQATKIPLGVAMAAAVVVYGIGQAIGKL